MSKKGLGRGFDSLIPTEFDKAILLDNNERIQKLLIRDVIPNPEQPRRTFDEQSLDELAESIKRHGVLQPVIVSPEGKTYVLVAGERRWRAAERAGLEDIPAIVRQRKELERLEIALIENVQRVDLSPLEQAVSIERLSQQFNIEYQEIAKRLGKAQSTVINIVRLLKLPLEAREALNNRQITEGHARAILALKDPAKQAELLNLILKNKWTVRQAEQFVVSVKKGSETKHARKATIVETPDTKKLGKRLKTKVTVHRTARGGKLEIHYKNDDDLSSLIEKLKKTV